MILSCGGNVMRILVSMSNDLDGVEIASGFDRPFRKYHGQSNQKQYNSTMCKKSRRWWWKTGEQPRIG
jgi:hypothetical protein